MKQYAKLATEAKSPGEAAGLWWAEALLRPKHDNGDDSDRGAMSQLLANVMAFKYVDQLTEPALDRFADELAKSVDDLLEQTGQLILDVDYDPSRLLVKASEAAGLELVSCSWPWKTTMWITPYEVEVRHGYGAPVQTIWQRA